MNGLLKNDDSYFRGASTTHFLWSVADNQDTLKRNDMGLLDFIQIKIPSSSQSQQVTPHVP